MKKKILFIERKFDEGPSIENVFRQIADNLSKDKFESSFQKLEYLNDAFGTLKNLFLFRKKTADIFHITGHIHYIALIMPRKNTVLTIHDVGILYIRKGLRRFVLKKLLFDLPIRKLKYITAVSEAAKQEIIFYTKCADEKIRVIENPVQEYFVPSGEKKFNVVCPIILQIGTRPNKNVVNLIRAVKNVKCRLKIIGVIDDEIKEELEKNEVKFENESNLDNLQIRDEYQKADILVFCSTFEGFGLPIIEAQAMRTPVVTSNLSPMKEVAGAGAALADPFDFESIRKEIIKIIGDENFRNNLVKKGLFNIKRFNSRYIAGLYENFYEEIIETENL
ncbi:MAG: glycosyltransferase family 4 protein [Acidobacteriota bacterium]|nr:glycosyltransferase family 4 protein [Acidobacteriota bacterium]